VEQAIWREVAALPGEQLSALYKLGGLLGLNPAERARINVPAPPQEEDPDDVFFRPHVVGR
jgi:phage terminase small subunit